MILTVEFSIHVDRSDLAAWILVPIKKRASAKKVSFNGLFWSFFFHMATGSQLQATGVVRKMESKVFSKWTGLGFSLQLHFQVVFERDAWVGGLRMGQGMECIFMHFRQASRSFSGPTGN